MCLAADSVGQVDWNTLGNILTAHLLGEACKNVVSRGAQQKNPGGGGGGGGGRRTKKKTPAGGVSSSRATRDYVKRSVRAKIDLAKLELVLCGY